MADNKSQNSMGSSVNRNLARECAICGKKETAHWTRHWATQHYGKEIKVRVVGEALQEPDFLLNKGAFKQGNSVASVNQGKSRKAPA